MRKNGLKIEMGKPCPEALLQYKWNIPHSYRRLRLQESDMYTFPLIIQNMVMEVIQILHLICLEFGLWQLGADCDSQ